MKAFVLALLFASAVLAQAATHSVAASWVDGVNPAGTTTYTLYRATGACPAVAPGTVLPTSPTFAALGNTLTLTLTDNTVTAGTTYCYLVSATPAGQAESIGNPLSQATVPTTLPGTPVTQLKTTAK